VALTERETEDGIARLALALHDVIQTHVAPAVFVRSKAAAI
jgi:hypothetical protein